MQMATLSSDLTGSGIQDLIMPVPAISTATTIAEVADLFLTESYQHLLCLPVLDGEQIVGTMSRYSIMRIFLQQFGREIFGPRSVSRFMNTRPLILSEDADIAEACGYVRANIRQPITEDFVVISEGRYLGMGRVLSLLELMEEQAERRGQALILANRNLKRSQMRLVQSEKMASLGQMVAGVTHEINTPLGYVRSNTELAQDLTLRIVEVLDTCHQLCQALLDGSATDEKIGEYLHQAALGTSSLVEQGVAGDIEHIFRDSLYGLEQIGELVMNLKNFSRLDRAKVDRVDINSCIEGALSIARSVIKDKATVTCDFATDVIAECAPSQINQVLLNLLTNAAQAIPGMGEIHIVTRAGKRQIAIMIRDNGAGIPDEIKKRIFDPFFTTKPVGEGTGLGLSISYQIIRQHRGSIDVRSEPGKGTEFIIRLPRTQATGVKHPVSQPEEAIS